VPINFPPSSQLSSRLQTASKLCSCVIEARKWMSLRECGTAESRTHHLSIKSPVPTTMRPHHTDESQLSIFLLYSILEQSDFIGSMAVSHTCCANSITRRPNRWVREHVTQDRACFYCTMQLYNNKCNTERNGETSALLKPLSHTLRKDQKSKYNSRQPPLCMA